MKILRHTAAVMCLILIMSIMSPLALAADAPPELKSSKSVVVGDMSNGRILYSVDAYTRREPASTTKMVTLLLAVEAIEAGRVSADDMVTASENCRQGLDSESSTANIFAGETMSFKNLLYCVGVASANEACNIVAEHVSGSIEKFVELMNSRADELGCTGTHFANTNGMPLQDHYTTARDFFVIACEAMRHPLFAEIVGTANYTLPATNKMPERYMRNSNALINDKSIYGSNYVYEGAIGIKTGHTRSAGYCLIGAAQRNGVNIITVVMGANGDPFGTERGTIYFENFTDTIALMDWCFANYSYRSVVEKGFRAGVQPVEINGRSGELPLACAEEINALVPNDFEAESLIRNIVLNADVLSDAPPEGTELGSVSFTDDDGSVYGTVPLVAAGEIEFTEQEPPERSLQQKLATAIVCVLLAVFALVLVFALVRRHNIKKAERARRRRAAMRGSRR